MNADDHRSEKVAKQSNGKWICKNNCDHIEAVGMVVESEQFAIGAGGTCELVTLAQIDVCLRGCEPVGSTRLHFDEAERVAVVSDDVDFSVDDCAAQVASDWKREVRGDQTITELFEISGSVLLAKFAEFQRTDRRSHVRTR